MKNKLGTTLRGVLLVTMGMSMVMTLLGAVGTSCLAWNGNFYGAAFKWIVPYMPTYQMLVYVSLVAAVAMTLVLYAIARGDRWFYLGAIVTLIVGGGAAAVQMFYTSSLKQVAFLATPPTNIRFYITVATLVLFVIIRIPGIWNKTGLGSTTTKPGSPFGAGGVALILTGATILTTPLWAGPSHTLDGYNLVDTLIVPLLVDGVLLIAGGIVLIVFRNPLGALLPKRNSRWATTK